MTTWEDFLPAARRIVIAEAALWPNSRGVVAISFGGGSGSGKFSRTGTGVHVRDYSVPSSILSLIDSNVSSTTTDPALAGKQTNLFGRLMDDTPQAQPGYQQLLNAANLDPTTFSGKDQLEKVASIDPYSGVYEDNTYSAFQQRASDAMAMAATGPEAVRGGDARTGIAQGVLADRLAQDRGAELRAAQQQDTQNVLGAAQGLANVETGRLGITTGAASGLGGLAELVNRAGLGASAGVDSNRLANINLLQLASQLQGKTNDTQTDNFKGHGDQSNWQAGLSCCFTFVEALNGLLPWYVEAARIDMWTPERAAGYTKMSRWLVPLMRRSRIARTLVNVLLVKPFLKWGAWLYGDSDSALSACLAPWCKMWLSAWRIYGCVR